MRLARTKASRLANSAVDLIVVQHLACKSVAKDSQNTTALQPSMLQPSVLQPAPCGVYPLKQLHHLCAGVALLPPRCWHGRGPQPRPQARAGKPGPAGAAATGLQGVADGGRKGGGCGGWRGGRLPLQKPLVVESHVQRRGGGVGLRAGWNGIMSQPGSAGGPSITEQQREVGCSGKHPPHLILQHTPLTMWQLRPSWSTTADTGASLSSSARRNWAAMAALRSDAGRRSGGQTGGFVVDAIMR
jgi:hypothetical protein